MSELNNIPATIDKFGDINFSPDGEQITVRNFCATRGNDGRPDNELILSLIIERLHQELKELKKEGK